MGKKVAKRPIGGIAASNSTPLIQQAFSKSRKKPRKTEASATANKKIGVRSRPSKASAEEEAAGADASHEKERRFGARLAHTEKRIRDSAFRALSQWLSKSDGLASVELLKVWKGLFYSFWMSDMVPVQNQLALRVGRLVHVLPAASVMPWLRAFFETMQREWDGIDRLRMDKFYVLVRSVVREAMQLVAAGGWDEEQVDELAGVLMTGALKSAAGTGLNSGAKGLAYHVIDLFAPELGKVAGAAAPPAAIETLCGPFYGLACATSDAVALRRLGQHFFGEMLDWADATKAAAEKGAAAGEVKEVDEAAQVLRGELTKMKVAELRELLSTRGLETGGKKALLVDRLCLAEKAEQEPAAEGEGEDGADAPPRPAVDAAAMAQQLLQFGGDPDTHDGNRTFLNEQRNLFAEVAGIKKMPAALPDLPGKIPNKKKQRGKKKNKHRRKGEGNRASGNAPSLTDVLRF